MNNRVMSLGSYCFIAETLRDLTGDLGYYLRESGGLDWVNNFDGIKGLVRALNGSLYKNIKRKRWLEDSWWCDLKPCQSIWNMYYPHENLNNRKVRRKVLKRLSKLEYYGKSRYNYFMYLLREDENNFHTVEYFAKICEILGIKEKVIIIGKSDFIRKYRNHNSPYKFDKVWYNDLAYDAYTRSDEEWYKAQNSILECLRNYGIVE